MRVMPSVMDGVDPRVMARALVSKEWKLSDCCCKFRTKIGGVSCSILKQWKKEPAKK